MKAISIGKTPTTSYGMVRNAGYICQQLIIECLRQMCYETLCCHISFMYLLLASIQYLNPYISLPKHAGM